jgi:hypothetical protein
MMPSDLGIPHQSRADDDETTVIEASDDNHVNQPRQGLWTRLLAGF